MPRNKKRCRRGPSASQGDKQVTLPSNPVTPRGKAISDEILADGTPGAAPSAYKAYKPCPPTPSPTAVREPIEIGYQIAVSPGKPLPPSKTTEFKPLRDRLYRDKWVRPRNLRTLAEKVNVLFKTAKPIKNCKWEKNRATQNDYTPCPDGVSANEIEFDFQLPELEDLDADWGIDELKLKIKDNKKPGMDKLTEPNIDTGKSTDGKRPSKRKFSRTQSFSLRDSFEPSGERSRFGRALKKRVLS